MLRQASKQQPCNWWWYNCTVWVAIKGIICVNHAQDYHWINYTSQIPFECGTSPAGREEVLVIILTIFMQFFVHVCV